MVLFTVVIISLSVLFTGGMPSSIYATTTALCQPATKEHNSYCQPVYTLTPMFKGKDAFLQVQVDLQGNNSGRTVFHFPQQVSAHYHIAQITFRAHDPDASLQAVEKSGDASRLSYVVIHHPGQLITVNYTVASCSYRAGCVITPSHFAFCGERLFVHIYRDITGQKEYPVQVVWDRFPAQWTVVNSFGMKHFEQILRLSDSSCVPVGALFVGGDFTCITLPYGTGEITVALRGAVGDVQDIVRTRFTTMMRQIDDFLGVPSDYPVRFIALTDSAAQVNELDAAQPTVLIGHNRVVGTSVFHVCPLVTDTAALMPYYLGSELFRDRAERQVRHTMHTAVFSAEQSALLHGIIDMFSQLIFFYTAGQTYDAFSYLVQHYNELLRLYYTRHTTAAVDHGLTALRALLTVGNLWHKRERDLSLQQLFYLLLDATVTGTWDEALHALTAKQLPAPAEQLFGTAASLSFTTQKTIVWGFSVKVGVEGVFVTKVMPGSAAYKAGVRVGDKIVRAQEKCIGKQLLAHVYVEVDGQIVVKEYELQAGATVAVPYYTPHEEGYYEYKKQLPAFTTH